jgi:hypothetical protein
MESSREGSEVESVSDFSETESPVNKKDYDEVTFEGIDPACCECDDGGKPHLLPCLNTQ